MERPADQQHQFSFDLPQDVAALELMWKVIEALQKEHGARVELVDFDLDHGVAEIVLPRPRPAA